MISETCLSTYFHQHIDEIMEKYFSSLSTYKELILRNLDDNVYGGTKRVMESSFLMNENNEGENGDIPGLLIVSKSQFLANAVASRHFNLMSERKLNLKVQSETRKRTIESEISYHNNKYEIIYEQYHNHIEIDLALFNRTSNDRSIVCGFLKDMLLRRDITRQKHKILLHGIETLNNNTIVSLRSIVENSSEHAYFVLTCGTLSPSIQASFLSRLFYINISCDFDIMNMINILIANRDQSLNTSLATTLMRVAKNDILNICILLHLSPELFHDHVSSFTGHLEKMIQETLSKCISCVCKDEGRIYKTNNNKDLAVFGKEIRLLCTKIGAACTSLVDVAHSVIKFVAIHYPRVVHDVAHLSAEMQHTAIQSNKELFILELYFHQVLMNILD